MKVVVRSQEDLDMRGETVVRTCGVLVITWVVWPAAAPQICCWHRFSTSNFGKLIETCTVLHGHIPIAHGSIQRLAC